MFKKISLILLLGFATNLLALNKNQEIINPPSATAINIITSSLASLQELKTQGKDTLKNINTLIEIKLISNLDTHTAVKVALKKYWRKLTPAQNLIFERYIVQSLIRDYSGFLTEVKSLDKVNINVLPKIKRKKNRAIVPIELMIDKDSKPVNFSLKMIHFDKWKIYDLEFSGVSLMKNYRSQFNSYIQRKGIDALIKKLATKIR
jgi:phospholipid transport system substrate-binding protein